MKLVVTLLLLMLTHITPCNRFPDMPVVKVHRRLIGPDQRVIIVEIPQANPKVEHLTVISKMLPLGLCDQKVVLQSAMNRNQITWRETLVDC